MLKTILLIDDDKNDNFLHKIVIEDFDPSIQTVSKESVQSAIEYLEQKENTPDLILLDINLRGFSGWDFIEQYQLSKNFKTVKPIIVMLTTSDFSSDIEKANTYSIVSGYYNKPLSELILNEIIKQHFKK